MINISSNESADKSSASPDFERILHQIELLRLMTMARGCTADEAAVAARKIGEAIQRHGLVVRPPLAVETQNRIVLFPHVFAIAATEKALLYEIDAKQIWVPLSQIAEESEVLERGDFGTLAVTRWYAQRKGLYFGGGR
jgi:hypothetical protein